MSDYQIIQSFLRARHDELIHKWIKKFFLSNTVCSRPLFSFQDLFNIGEITVETGNAFGCADPELWYNNPQASRSGLSIGKNTIKYDYLVNTDGKNKSAS